MDVCYFYTPALRLDSLLRKGRELKADMLVIDLEDATHLHAKDEARRKVASFDFGALDAFGMKIAVRINSLASFHGIEDLRLLRSLYESKKCSLGHVLVPKINHANDVKTYRSLFQSLPFVPKIYSFIETVEAVDNAEAIAAVSDALCFGQADLSAEMYSPNAAFLEYARARLCIAAAKHLIPAIDTNSFDIENMASFRQECFVSKAVGFTGKAAIHPDQVVQIKEVFAGTAEMADKYRSSIDAYFASQEGFVIRNGEVIAPPFIAKARRMLKFYEKVGVCPGRDP
jgi:citrate lyase beta subunit